jgi:hypothetical protein
MSKEGGKRRGRRERKQGAKTIEIIIVPGRVG